MKPEVNFYQVDETIIKSLAPLLLKILEEKKKVLVFCKNEAQVKEIDSALWSYGRNKFIPHVTNQDHKDFEMARQPILVTDKEENLNKSEYLVFLSEPSEKFINSFSRVFYFYEAGKMLAKTQPTKSYKKAEGKWIKI